MNDYFKNFIFFHNRFYKKYFTKYFCYITLQFLIIYLITLIPKFTSNMLKTFSQNIFCYKYIQLIFAIGFLNLLANYLSASYMQYKPMYDISKEILTNKINQSYDPNNIDTVEKIETYVFDKPQMILNYFNSLVNIIISIFKILVILYTIYNIIGYNILWLILSLITIQVIFRFISINNIVLWEKYIKSYDEFKKSILDVINGIHTVKTLGMEKVFINNLKSKANMVILTNSLQRKRDTLYVNLRNLSYKLILPIILVTFLKYKIIDIINLFGLIIMIEILISESIPLISNILDLKKINDVAKDLKTSLELPIDKFDNFDFGDESINLLNITYHNHKNNVIFNNFNLKINKGESFVITGDSGIGKTTLLLIMQGHLFNYNGKVKIGNTILSNKNVRTYREKISVVNQNPYMFDTTIKDNLCLGEPYQDEKIYQVLSKLELSEWVKSLPQKLDTKIGPNGLTISGGEKVRIALARVLLKGGDYLFLDEITANLDSYHEEIIMKNIFKNFNFSTIIAISHRKSTIAFFKNVIDLNIINKKVYDA